MASGEKYIKDTLSDVSWREGFSQDPYYWLTNSYQYSENLNTDDELHGIKLSQKANFASWVCPNCQLISAWDKIFALPLSGWNVKYFNKNNWRSPGDTWLHINWSSSKNIDVMYWNWTVFQDYFWFWTSMSLSNPKPWVQPVASGFFKINTWSPTNYGQIVPHDHTEATDEAISNPSDDNGVMTNYITAVLNYNNTRLVVWVWQDLRVYYPELDMSLISGSTVQPWKTWWKKVQHFEDWCTIIALTCTFQYLKVRVTDEWRNTKVYYYQGNDDLRNTFVYDMVDLTNTKVLRVYPVNWIDYYTASLDWTHGFVSFNKLLWTTVIPIFKQRPWLSDYDANQKATYFIWPTSHNASYLDGKFYVADSYGVRKFNCVNTRTDTVDRWYLKWKLNSSTTNTPWLAICENFVYVSDENWLWQMRTYDTWVDGYQQKWLLISREMEWKYGGCVSKMLDEIRLHFELNPLISNSQDAWDIDIYVSPNNMWRNVDPDSDSTGWYHVMHIDGSKSSQNRKTRYEKTNQLNNLNSWSPAFEFDWETITYCVVIRRWSSNAQWTPVVREVQMQYHLKGKTNNIYDIQ